MLTALALVLLTQTSPAVRRSTPLSDDPGMVVRQVGTVTTNCLNCGVLVASDGGIISVIGLDGGFMGSVYVDGGQLVATQGPGQDGGAWNVYIQGGNLAVSSSVAFDGGSIGYMQMPDGGALQVYVVNSTGSSGGGWVPDGGFIGSVAQSTGLDGGAWLMTSAVKVSTANSTTTPLGAGATFTGAWESTLDFGFMNLTVYSDQSTTSGLRIDWSADGTNLDASDSYDVTGGTGRALAMPVRSRYMRIRYTNGGTPQSVFRLNVLFRQNGSPNNTHPVDWPVSHTSVATLSRSVIVGESTGGGGGYHNVKVTPSGSLTTEVTQSSFPWLVAGADGGAVQVGGTWFPDGGSIGKVTVTNFDGGVGITNVAQTSGWAPDPASVTTPGVGQFTFDKGDSLRVRAQVLTDEGMFSDGFPGSSLATTITGTATFTNGSSVVTGIGTSFTTEVTSNHHLKASSASETAWARVDSVQSDTELTLAEPYTGPTVTTTINRSNWKTQTPVGANMSVTGSTVSLTNSITNGDVLALYRDLDYPTLNMTVRAALSSRVANQTVSFAFVDNLEPATEMEAEFRFSGTDATQVDCVTAFDSGGANVTTATIPGGGTTATQHTYELSVGKDRVTFIIDGILVATHQYEIPEAYTALKFGVFMENSAPLGASSTVDASWVHLESVNTLDSVVTNPVAARLQAQVQGGQREGAPITTNPVIIGGSDGAVARVMKVTTSGSVLTTGDKTNNLTTSDNTNVGTLPGVATSSAPSYSEGKQVAVSTDLSGKLRTRVDDPVRVVSTDGGAAFDVVVTGGTWTPDGGALGSVNVSNFDGGVWISSLPPVSVTGSVAVTGPVTDAQLRASPVNVVVTNYDAGVWVASSALPTGAATSANQTTGNNSLSSIDTKTPSLGQATMANSTPVVIASNQSTLNVTVTNYDAGVWVSSMPAVTQGTSPWVVSGTVTTGGLTDAQLRNTPVNVIVTNYDAGLWVASSALPNGAATSALQTTGNNSLSSIDTKLPNLVSGRVPVDGSGSTQPVSGTVAATQSGGWTVGVNNFPATQTVTGTVTATVAFDGGVMTAVQGPSSDGGTNWPVEVASPVYVIILDGGVSGGGGGTVTQGGGQDGGAWAVYVVNPASAGSVVQQGVGFDGGGTWGVWIEGGNLSVSSSVAFDGGNIGYMLMPDGGPLEVALTSGTISIAAVDQGPGQDGGAWNVSVNNFPASQAVTGPLTDAQLRATPVPISGTVTANAGSGPFPVSDNGGSLTVDGTVAATQSGTWSVRTQDGAGNALASSTSAPAGTEQALIVRNIPSGTQTISGTVDTELPAAGALGDGAANPTTPTVGTALLGYNGTTWDRLRSTIAGGLLVNVSNASIPVTQSGTWNLNNISGTVSLPTGAATETTLGTRLADSTFTGRFAAPASLADTTANPSVTSIGSYLMAYNGTTWDRLRKSATGLLVDIQNTSLAVTQSGTWNIGTLTSITNAVTVTQSTPSSLRTQTASEGTSGSAISTVSSVIAGTDGTNAQVPRLYDVDTNGAATQYALGSTVVVPNFGGGISVTGSADSGGKIGLDMNLFWKRVATPTTTAVTCATTATLAPGSALSSRTTITLYNNSNVVIYIGGSGVTTANGLPLQPGASFTDDVRDSPYYCRVVSGTAELRVLEN